MKKRENIFVVRSKIWIEDSNGKVIGISSYGQQKNRGKKNDRFKNRK